MRGDTGDGRREAVKVALIKVFQGWANGGSSETALDLAKNNKNIKPSEWKRAWEGIEGDSLQMEPLSLAEFLFSLMENYPESKKEDLMPDDLLEVSARHMNSMVEKDLRTGNGKTMAFSAERGLIDEDMYTGIFLNVHYSDGIRDDIDQNDKLTRALRDATNDGKNEKMMNAMPDALRKRFQEELNKPNKDDVIKDLQEQLKAMQDKFAEEELNKPNKDDAIKDLRAQLDDMKNGFDHGGAGAGMAGSPQKKGFFASVKDMFTSSNAGKVCALAGFVGFIMLLTSAAPIGGAMILTAMLGGGISAAYSYANEERQQQQHQHRVASSTDVMISNLIEQNKQLTKTLNSMQAQFDEIMQDGAAAGMPSNWRNRTQPNSAGSNRER